MFKLRESLAVTLNPLFQVGWCHNSHPSFRWACRSHNSPAPFQLGMILAGQGLTTKGTVPRVDDKCFSSIKMTKKWKKYQVVCSAPTPLGPAYPGGLFGAIEAGQEEAVKFYQAWKAQVVWNLSQEKIVFYQHLKVCPTRSWMKFPETVCSYGRSNNLTLMFESKMT